MNHQYNGKHVKTLKTGKEERKKDTHKKMGMGGEGGGGEEGKGEGKEREGVGKVREGRG